MGSRSKRVVLISLPSLWASFDGAVLLNEHEGLLSGEDICGNGDGTLTRVKILLASVS
jgi:hypothetical protein